jgi:heme a synthase
MSVAAPERAIRLWLLVCCGMIGLMALIGAITRLTESGLSIVQWEPVKDMLPPLTEAAWAQAFAEYKTIPQYRLLNQGMSLTDFQAIYFWEWLHRLWGRLIGLVYALPFAWFAWRHRLPRPLLKKLWLGLALGGLQGGVGKFMVASGLSELVYVSHYRLALHLGLALTIYAYLLWVALGLHAPSAPALPVVAPPVAPRVAAALRRHGWVALGCFALTLLWGAFVAGLKAGWVYNSFPLMAGAWLPDAAWTLQPLWLNALANTALVQFMHRWIAVTSGMVIWWWCWRLWRAGLAAGLPERRWLLALSGMVGLQIGLGILTLLYAVPILLGTLHQAGAITLLTLLIIQQHRLCAMPAKHLIHSSK